MRFNFCFSLVKERLTQVHLVCVREFSKTIRCQLVNNHFLLSHMWSICQRFTHSMVSKFIIFSGTAQILRGTLPTHPLLNKILQYCSFLLIFHSQFQAICAQESGVPPDQAKWFNIIWGVADFSGKLIAGLFTRPLLKRDQSKYLCLATLFMYTVSSFLLSLNTTFQWLASYMAVVGFWHGIAVSLLYIVTFEIVGNAAYPAACGLVIFLSSISWTIGPPLGGSFSLRNICVRPIKKNYKKNPTKNYLPTLQ